MESFDPRRNRFDVVIIDEASQADVTALTAVYMGRQVVVVGDHEQVSPVAVGQKLDEVQYLEDKTIARCQRGTASPAHGGISCEEF